MGTQLDSNKILEFPLNLMWTAPMGAALPTAPWPAAMPAGWSVLGRVSDSGFEGARDQNTTSIYDSNGVLSFEGDSQLRESYTCTALETNNVTEGLKYPNAVKTVLSAGTAEVQSLAVTGTPAGSLILSRGGVIATVAAGANAATLQTAIRTLPDLGTATVTGSSAPFAINYPQGLGNVALLGVDNSGVTGGSYAVTETTPGVLPVYSWVPTSSGILSASKRLFALDEANLATGRAMRTPFVGKAKATGLGATTAGTPKQTPFTIVKYEDISIGGLSQILSTLDAHNPTFAGF